MHWPVYGALYAWGVCLVVIMSVRYGIETTAAGLPPLVVSVVPPI